MDNLKLARETMYNKDKKIVVVREGDVVYESDGFGIKPLYVAFNTVQDKMYGASCADRVIGKAASWIYVKAGIKELYCDVITTTAKKMLASNNINVIFAEETEYIINREKTGMCPVEQLAKDEDDFGILMKNIEDFLIEKKLL